MKVKKITITLGESCYGFELNSADGHVLDWNKMEKAEQIKVLNAFANGYHFFNKFYKNQQ